MRGGTLYRIGVDGEFAPIDNTYEAIKRSLDDQPFDFVKVHPRVGFYIDDEGMLNGSRLNVPASLMAGRVLYGIVVLTAGEADDEGDTQPPDDEVVKQAEFYAHLWSHLVEDAIRLGQDPYAVANEATLPPPVIIMGTEAIDNWLAEMAGEGEPYVDEDIHRGER